MHGRVVSGCWGLNGSGLVAVSVVCCSSVSSPGSSVVLCATQC